MSLPTLVLKPGRDKSLRRRHPWIFSGAVARVDHGVMAGATVRVLSSDGAFLAYASFSPQSQIVARVWSFSERDSIDAAFFQLRLRDAINRRASLTEETDALRLVHAESDGIPALIVDRYADTLVVQFLSAGIEVWRETIVAQLAELTGCANIYERSDAEVRELEGLPVRNGALRGRAPDRPLAIREHGTSYLVDVVQGHKTGFYLDQRDNRLHVRGIASGKRVLNAFCYSGGFSIEALRGDAASVVSIDSAAAPMALAREHVRSNGLDASRATWIEGDVLEVLRKQRDARQEFDLIVLDPPKFAPTAAHVDKAARAYKDINLLALKLLASQGVLMTFSCSGGVHADLFQKIVAGAAVDARVDAQIVQRLGAAVDHPVAIHFPEGDYLKGLLLRRT